MNNRGPHPEKFHCNVTQVRVDGFQWQMGGGGEAREGHVQWEQKLQTKPEGKEVAKGLVVTHGEDTEQDRWQHGWQWELINFYMTWGWQFGNNCSTWCGSRERRAGRDGARRLAHRPRHLIRVRTVLGASSGWCLGSHWTPCGCSPCPRRRWSAGSSSVCRPQSQCWSSAKKRRQCSGALATSP